MLVLTRKVGQRIRIGEATITVVLIRGNRVRLGIDAPASVLVLREELGPPRDREEAKP